MRVALREKLVSLRSRSQENSFSASNTLGTESFETIRQAKEFHGVVIVHEVFSLDALNSAREKAIDAYYQDIVPQIPEASRPKRETIFSEVVSSSSMWPTGIVGNKSFGFLISQPESRDQMPTLVLSSQMEIQMAMGSAYQANIALMSHKDSAKALEILSHVSGLSDFIISQDFVKIHRGDLTAAHVDIYEESEERIQRMQAMGFGLNEGDVKLCFLQFSHLPEVQEIITRMIGKNIFGTRGCQRLPLEFVDEIVSCFQEAGCVQFGNARDLVMWKPGVIHLEMQLKKDKSLVIRNKKDTTTERYVVGVHTPIGLSQQELREIGFAASRGFIFHPYHKANDGRPAGLNSVHRKRTQFLKPRIRTQLEKDRFASLQESIFSKQDVDHWEAQLSPSEKLCLGIK